MSSFIAALLFIVVVAACAELEIRCLRKRRGHCK